VRKIVSMNPENLKFTKTHEWVSVDGDVATVGISDFAVKLLTDIVFLALPKVGKSFKRGESMGEIESVKAVSDVYAPLQGEVIAVNESLPDQLALLSDSPFDKAWIVRLKISDPSQLNDMMNHADYVRHCDTAGH
jgi:glycine cleavage system H protein